jgi:hypothetical protein
MEVSCTGIRYTIVHLRNSFAQNICKLPFKNKYCRPPFVFGQSGLKLSEKNCFFLLLQFTRRGMTQPQTADAVYESPLRHSAVAMIKM